MSDERQGFEIRGTFYPWVEEMGLLDPVLIRRVTGIPYTEFVESWMASIAADEDTSDPIVMTGLIAVAIWHQHPLWGIEKVAKFVQSVSHSELDIVGDEEDTEEEDGQSPPLTAPSGADSGSTRSGSSTPNVLTSNGQAESHLAQNLVASGEPGSVTGSPV